MQLHTFLKKVSKIRLLGRIRHSQTGCETPKIQAYLIDNKVNSIQLFYQIGNITPFYNETF